MFGSTPDTLVLYANAKLTSKLELASLGGEMRLILVRVCSGEWSSGEYLRCSVSCRGNKVICERHQCSMDSIFCVCALSSELQTYSPKIMHELQTY